MWPDLYESKVNLYNRQIEIFRSEQRAVSVRMNALIQYEMRDMSHDDVLDDNTEQMDYMWQRMQWLKQRIFAKQMLRDEFIAFNN